MILVATSCHYIGRISSGFNSPYLYPSSQTMDTGTYENVTGKLQLQYNVIQTLFEYLHF